MKACKWTLEKFLGYSPAQVVNLLRASTGAASVFDARSKPRGG